MVIMDIMDSIVITDILYTIDIMGIIDIKGIMNIMYIMNIIDIMDMIDIMEIMEIVDIMNITSWVVLAGAVLALVLFLFSLLKKVAFQYHRYGKNKEFLSFLAIFVCPNLHRQ